MCGSIQRDEGIEAMHVDLILADSLDEGVPPVDPERDTEQDAGQAERMHQLSESDTECQTDQKSCERGPTCR